MKRNICYVIVLHLLVTFSLFSISSADSLFTSEARITFSTDYETTPTLGNDGSTDLVVYTKRPLLTGGALGPGDIYYQRLDVNGDPIGDPPVQVTSGTTDDQLNDVYGNYIIFTAYDSVTSTSGAIIVYEISTNILHTIGTATIIQEPKIHGDRIVWREGGALSATVMYYELGWIGYDFVARRLAGPIPPTFDVQIGSRYAVWAELDLHWGDDRSTYDVYAYDFTLMTKFRFTDTAAIDERRPATSGEWIVWQQEDGSTSTIEAQHMITLERITIDNGAGNYNPSIDGDIISWESDVAGNLDIWIYSISREESFQLTTDSADQYLNDVYGNMIAYVDMSEVSEDVYVSTAYFSPETVVLNFDLDADAQAVSAGAIASEQWAGIGIHMSCQNNMTGHPNACVILDSNDPPDDQNDLHTFCQNNVLVVARDIIDLNGDGLVDEPGAEENGGQIRIAFDDPVDLSMVTIADMDPEDGGSAIMVVTDAGGGTIIVPIPVIGNGIVQDVVVDVPYAIELTVSFVKTGTLARVEYYPTVPVAFVSPVNNECVDWDWPIADAGDDQNVNTSAEAYLDGSNSTDGTPNEIDLAYEWNLIEKPVGSIADLQAADSPSPSFTPDIEGTYIAELVVTRQDNDNVSYPDQVTINAVPPNQPPVAVCQDVEKNLEPDCSGSAMPEEIDGGSFDPDGDSITLSWPCGNCTWEISGGPGSVTETLMVTDDNGQSDTCEAIITFFDNIPPIIECPDDVSIECGTETDLSAVGQATASDNCLPILLDITYVDIGAGICPTDITRTWTAIDGSGNNDSCDQIISLMDTIPPDINVPTDISIPAVNSSGAVVIFTATANDAVDGNIIPVCEPPSGSTFPIGSTLVECTATDSSNNIATEGFTVIISDSDNDGDGVPISLDSCPEENATGFDVDENGCIDNTTGLIDLCDRLVAEGVIAPQLQNSLTKKIENAQKKLDKDNICTAINGLESLINQVNAQRGKKISNEAADQVIAYTESVIAWLTSQLPPGENC